MGGVLRPMDCCRSQVPPGRRRLPGRIRRSLERASVRLSSDAVKIIGLRLERVAIIARRHVPVSSRPCLFFFFFLTGCKGVRILFNRVVLLLYYRQHTSEHLPIPLLVLYTRSCPPTHENMRNRNIILDSLADQALLLMILPVPRLQQNTPPAPPPPTLSVLFRYRSCCWPLFILGDDVDTIGSSSRSSSLARSSSLVRSLLLARSSSLARASSLARSSSVVPVQPRSLDSLLDLELVWNRQRGGKGSLRVGEVVDALAGPQSQVTLLEISGGARCFLDDGGANKQGECLSLLIFVSQMAISSGGRYTTRLSFPIYHATEISFRTVVSKCLTSVDATRVRRYLYA